MNFSESGRRSGGLLPAGWGFGIAIWLVGTIFVCGKLVANGKPLFVGAALACALLPLLATWALKAPIAFPYPLYAAIVPMDYLLSTGSGATVTKYLSILSAAAIAFWAIRKREFAPPGKAAIAWLAFVCWAFISQIWTIAPPDEAIAMQRLLLVFAFYFLLASVVPRLRDFAFVVWAIVIGGILSAIYVCDLFFTSRLPTNDGSVARVTVQVGQSSIDPNMLAQSLLLPLLLTVLMLVRSRGLLLRTFLAGGSAVIMWAILATQSRGGLLGVVAMVLMYVARSRYRLRIGIMAFLLIGLAFSQDFVRNRFSDALTTGGAGRTSIWSTGFLAFKHNWLLGYGIGSFPTAYDRFFLSVYQSKLTFADWHRPAHNIIVGTSVELGIVGLILLVAALALQFWDLHAITRDNPMYDLRVALEACYCGFIVTSLFVNPLIEKDLWLVLATLAQFRLVALTQPRAGTAGSAPEIADVGPLRVNVVTAPLRPAMRGGLRDGPYQAE